MSGMTIKEFLMWTGITTGILLIIVLYAILMSL